MPKLIIEKALKQHGISKRELGRRTKLSESNVFKLFEKGYNPTFQTLIRIARAIGCRVCDLIDE